MDEISQSTLILDQNCLPQSQSDSNSQVTSGKPPKKRRFECPVFVAERAHGRSRTCNNIDVSTMSAVRRHLIRPSRGYSAQLMFLKLCPTCNEDIINKSDFELHHGINGQLCNIVRRQRKGAKVKEQWDALYQQVEATMQSPSTPQGKSTTSGDQISY
jgi:hypothetical protein